MAAFKMLIYDYDADYRIRWTQNIDIAEVRRLFRILWDSCIDHNEV